MSEEKPASDAVKEPAHGPRRRATEFLRRFAPSPANVIDLGVNWAKAMEFAHDAPADDGDDGWVCIGPRNVGGAIRALAQDPDKNHGSTFYAGTAGGGLWRTTDDGNTWEPLGEDSIGAVAVGAVAVAQNDAILYVGTGEPWSSDIPGVGLFRSIDHGVSFRRLAPSGTGAPAAADHYTRIRIDPASAIQAWVACNRGLWRFVNETAHQELPPTDEVTDLALVEDPAHPKTLTLLAAVKGVGIRRGVFDRQSKTTTWAAAPSPLLTSAGAPAANIGRVRVAIAPNNPNYAYALVEDLPPGGSGYPQPLYASTDGGVSFRQPTPVAAPWPADTPSPQAFYSMVLEVHPTNKDCVVAGHVNLYQSPDGGKSWLTTPSGGGWITWQNNLAAATRAEHGDIHAIVFDQRDATLIEPRIWVGNDGGLSFTDTWSAPFNWRKRSYGILAAQAVDITSHPTFPSLVGCGMQDNATFLSFGGPTWYMVGMADGAALAFVPGDPRRAHISWYNAVSQLTIGAASVLNFRTALPDIAPPGNELLAGCSDALEIKGPAPAGQDTGQFRQLVVGDPATANRLVVGATGAAYFTILGTTATFFPLATGPFTDPGAEVGALAIVPGSTNDGGIYVGTASGDIFAPQSLAAPGWVHTTPFAGPGPAAPWVAGIAVHPLHTQVVAACAYRADSPLMLSHDGGQHWFDATGTDHPLPPDVPVTSLAFDPTDETVLYAGTMVGVFVARDLPAYAAAPGTATAANPTWKTFNRGLGPVLVNDLEVVRETNTLRCGTFSRGCFEASLRTRGTTYATPEKYRVPPVRLSIRDHALDDSRSYDAAHRFTDDPRLPAAAPAPHLSGEQSSDIKVNAPELRDRTAYLQSERFGHQPDGAELDEQFVCETPLAGDLNIAYVQVHNRGWRRAENVQVFLYVADAGAAGAAPALDGLGFPNPPPEGFLWQWAALPQTVPVLPGQPRVVRFDWACPLQIQQNVALLAICRSPDDELPAAEIPQGAAKDYALGQRRAALRILPVVHDHVFIRDGLDDDGERGSVAWGGRSPDIIVMAKTAADAITPAQADDPNPATGPFANLNDPRRSDRVQPGDNTVFVRVHNRGTAAVNAEVQLWKVPLEKVALQIADGSKWEPVNPVVAVTGIPPGGWRMARIQLTGVPADPVPGLPGPWGKAFIFAAVARSLNPVGGAELESFPDVQAISNVDELWNTFTRAALANNAALRALRFGA